MLTDEVPIVAPEGFLEHAVAENVYAGTAMSRRAVYMYGPSLEKGPQGQIGAGLGMTTSAGSISLVPPTLDITHTGQEEVLDGVRIQFQMTPGTEAPSEMNFFFPDFRALCMAENATHNLHNLLTLRGAVVRDPRVWSRYLGEAIDLFTADADVAFASHHWPTWGRERIVTYLGQQRDLYGYLHDQTLRLINKGYTGIEAAEMIEMPPALEAAWHTHGYYGSVSHNVKAVYQRYMGWFDGNPANLWQHPPVERATRYVESMGAPTRWSRGPRPTSMTVICGSPSSCSTTWCSRSPTTPRRKAAAGVGVHDTRPRRRERHLAQLLPDGRTRAPRRSRAPADVAGESRHGRGADRRAGLRLDRDPDQRAEGVGSGLSRSTGISPTSTRRGAPR